MRNCKEGCTFCKGKCDKSFYSSGLQALYQKRKAVIACKLLTMDEDFGREDKAHVGWLQEPRMTT